MTDPVLEAFRSREFPATEAVHLDSASYGLLPRRTVEAVGSLTRRRNRPGGIPDPEPGAALRRARVAAARLLEVDPRQITLAPNTTYGLHLGVALAASGEPGTVVVSEGEFPANVLPWLALRDRGFDVRLVPLRDGGIPDERALARAALEPDVRVLAVSAVQFASGFRIDLERLARACREGGTRLVVDAIQALGTVPLAPAKVGVDVLATGAQKWLMGPWGAGFAWVAPEWWDRIRPPVVSWLAVEGGAYSTREGYALDYLADGRRFEPATLGVQDYLGMATSLEALLDLGVERVRRHQAGLHDAVRAWARRRGVRVVGPEDVEARAGIVALAVEDPDGAVQALRAEGIRGAVREGWLRLSPHAYVSEADVDRALAVLDRAVTRG